MGTVHKSGLHANSKKNLKSPKYYHYIDQFKHTCSLSFKTVLFMNALNTSRFMTKLSILGNCYSGYAIRLSAKKTVHYPMVLYNFWPHGRRLTNLSDHHHHRGRTDDTP